MRTENLALLFEINEKIVVYRSGEKSLSLSILLTNGK